MFNYRKLVRVLDDPKKLIPWLQGKKLILENFTCPCGENAEIEYREAGNPRWRCRKRSENDSAHQFSQSIVKNTVFEGSKFGIDRVVEFFYFFAIGKTDYAFLRREMSKEEQTTSDSTICQWLVFCREICFVSLDNMMEKEHQIDGEGHVVEIDESKIGKMKYHRGRKVDGQWIVGMIALKTGEAGEQRRGGSFRIEICPDNRRDQNTLLAMVRKHVKPGTTIMTNCWRGYLNLSDHGYNHLSVNQEEHFVDPNTWANTQTIESQWRPLKRFICRGGVRSEDLAMHLCEYLWRRQALINEEDIFSHFLQCVAEVYNPARHNNVNI